jgi:hypothetical protein
MATTTTVPMPLTVSSAFDLFFKRLLLLNSCWGTLPVAVADTPLRDRLFVAYLFADVVRDESDHGQQAKFDDTAHSLFLSVYG